VVCGGYWLALLGCKNEPWLVAWTKRIMGVEKGRMGQGEGTERSCSSSNVAAFTHMLTFPCSLPHFTMSDGTAMMPSRRCKDTTTLCSCCGGIA
jgi:hypothetical protein